MFEPAVRRLALAALLALGCANAAEAISQATPPAIDPDALEGATRFTTWQGIEPDKWATVWLIKRYVSPQAYFLLIPPNTDSPRDAVPFDVPGAAIRRAGQESMFRRLKQALALNRTELAYIDRIVHDIEVNVWEAPSHPHSRWFEAMYRQLQARYRRDQVPVDCYLSFFDAAARFAGQPDVDAATYATRLELAAQCPGLADEHDAFVPQRGHLEILRAISLGKRVVFIDTREDEEYAEVHLPGARPLRLREVSRERLADFQDADLLVPYCIKDFRGFEVAKAIRQLGFDHVATLSPHGLKGWLQAKLPVEQAGQLTAEQAREALLRCAMEPEICLEESR